MIRLGAHVRCTLTGFKGVAVGRTEYLYSVPVVLVDPCVVESGKITDSVWLSEARLVETDTEEPRMSLEGVIATEAK